MSLFSNFMQNKKLRYGSLATVLTVLLIVVVIAVNVLLGTLADRYTWKLDLTDEKMFSISDTTKDILRSLDQDVIIVTIYPEGQQDPYVEDLLTRYKNLSSHIQLETADPAKTPGLENQFSVDGKSISYGSILFSSGGKTKIISQNDLTQTSASEEMQMSFIVAEQRFSSAILYVTSEYSVSALFTTGHDEADTTDFQTFYSTLNASVKEIDLLTEDIPAGTQLLNIITPKRDFTEEEITKLSQYLSGGGNLQYFPLLAQNNLPRLNSLLQEWGIQVNNNYVVDQGAGSYYQDPVFLMPNIQMHEITKNLGRSARAVFPRSSSFTTVQTPGVTTAAVLETSADSFARSDFENGSTTKIDSDVDGPHTVMLTAEKTYENGAVGKIILYGSGDIATSPSLLQDQGYGVTDLLSGAYQYLTGEKDSVVEIAGKTYNYEALSMTSLNIYIILGVLAVIPLFILILGIVIWFKRRHL